MHILLLLPTICLVILSWQTNATPVQTSRTALSANRHGLGKHFLTVNLHVHGNAIHDHDLTRVATSPSERRDTSQHVTVRGCDFRTIQEFFDYAHRNNLNITAEVQECQNLCLMTYGNGNPDLSGIGVSHVYVCQATNLARC